MPCLHSMIFGLETQIFLQYMEQNDVFNLVL